MLGAAALAGSAAAAPAGGGVAAGEVTVAGPALEFKPGVTGAFDVWLKWGDFDGHEDARFEVEHASGVAGYALSQSHNPGWHFLGTYNLDRASRVLATNRGAWNQPNLRAPAGADALKLAPVKPRTIERRAGGLMTVVELNVGDELRFTCADGRTRRLRLTGTSAAPTRREGLAITEFSFTQEYEIDGRRESFTCTVPSSDFMGRPFERDGLLLWPDAVQDIFADCGGFEIEKDFRHVAGTCRPMRRARLMLQDAAVGRICPDKCLWWYGEKFWPLSPEQCYMGRDCWMGTWYEWRTFPSPRGNEVHCGIDINMPRSSPLQTPIALDGQHYFHSLKKGNNNNRWRGVRRWNAAETWWLQSHHIDTPYLVPEDVPLAAGVRYALSGGQWAGDFCHTHFNLRTFTYSTAADGERAEESFWVNPGVLFWQMQRDFPLPPRKPVVDVTAADAHPAALAMRMKPGAGSKGPVSVTRRGNVAFFKFDPTRKLDAGVEFFFDGWRVVEFREISGDCAAGTLEKGGAKASFAVRANAQRRYLRQGAAGAVYAPVYDLGNGAPLLVKAAFGAEGGEPLKTLDGFDWCYERFNLG